MTNPNTQSHTYAVKGTFTVHVNVTDANGAKATASSTITISPLPLALSFTTAPTTGTAGSPVSFTVTASGGTLPGTFSWNFGDGTANVANGSSNPNTLSHNYAAKGTFTVHVNVTDGNNNRASASATITIAGTPLTVSFTTAPTTGTVGTPVSFTATAAGDTAPYTFSWNFGDGTANVAGGITNPNSQSHTYQVKGTYSVKVNVTDANGKLASASATITVAPLQFVVVLTSAPTTGTVGTPVSFTASGSGGTAPYSFSWSFGDNTANVAGGTANPNTQTHSYATKGTFVVKVNATDTNGALRTASALITITGTPLAVAFNSPPTTGMVGTQVSFTATASGDTAPYTFSWNFGDGTANVAGGMTIPNTQSHTYAVKGTFTVRVNVTDANGAKATASSTITISPKLLSVTFTVSSNPTVGSPVTFTATGTGGSAPYTFSWNFGDGTILGDGAQVMHTYAVKGTYQVSVTITDMNGATANMGQMVTVAPLPLTASFTFTPAQSPTSPRAGQQVTFTASASGGTAPYSFSWSFGDNTAKGTGSPVTHIYAANGTFTVTLNTTDTNGKQFITSQTITVQPAILKVDFTFTPAAPTVSQSVTFTATSSGGTPPVSFSWTFGDGSTGTGSPVSHAYTVKGNFMVTLTGTDAAGQTASATHSVTVTPLALTANFGFTPGAPSTGQPVSFTATVTGGTAPYSFSWSFGDGTTGSSNPASHTYTTKGTFMVTLTVRDTNGASATASHSVTVTPIALAADFSFNPTSPTTNQQVAFTATVSGGTTQYAFSWNFGDTSTGTGNPVNHAYAQANTYTVTLTVTDANGATATASHTVTVSGFVQKLLVDFGPTTTLVGDTTFVSVITGGVSPNTCSWDFGDGSAVQTGCSPSQSPVHTYIATGNFTATLTVTDSAATTNSTSHVITVQVAPTVDAVTFKAHPFFPSQEDFKYHVSNLSTIPVDMSVTLNIVDGNGLIVSSQTFTTTLAPGSQTKFDLFFTPQAKVSYTFTSNMTYQATLPVGAGTSQTTTVTGTGPTVTGTFSER
jgi:PKD repeat protein